MMILLRAFCLLVCLVALTGGTPLAAQTFEPELVVNEKAITAYEIDQRARLLKALGGGGDTTELARSQLIDDRLREAIIERFELEADEAEIEAGVANFAQRRNASVEDVLGALSQRGIDPQTLRDFVANAIGWRNFVQARFRSSAQVSERDLDLALESSNSPIQESVRLQEIGISVEEFGEAEAAELAKSLSRSLNRGGNFTAAVRKYSRAPSAANDGRLDWRTPSQLPGQVATQVLALLPGEVTAPIPAGQGILIFKLLDIRQERRTVDETASDTVTFYQLIQPLPANAPASAVSAAVARAEAVRDGTELCRDLDDVVDDFDPSSGRSEPSLLGAVPGAIAERLRALETGDIEIFQDGRGVVLLMLCARAGEASPEQREALRRQLFNQRMNTFATNFLQELRGDAVIVER